MILFVLQVFLFFRITETTTFFGLLDVFSDNYCWEFVGTSKSPHFLPSPSADLLLVKLYGSNLELYDVIVF
jgi:hypothetical protein